MKKNHIKDGYKYAVLAIIVMIFILIASYVLNSVSVSSPMSP